jgi:5-methyltetrahydrofolate--homocysteine methyltransferase
MFDLDSLGQAIETGDSDTAQELTRAAIDDRLEPSRILAAMTNAMRSVGERFQRNELFVPEMLVAAIAMEDSMTILEPLLVGDAPRYSATAVIGSVRGDLHDIGKNLVGLMWKSGGIEVVDLGTNVEPATFADAVRVHEADLLGLSALLTTTMVEMEEAIRAVRAARPETRIVVGGAPVTPAYAEEIGADGFAPDAGAALSLARSVLRL